MVRMKPVDSARTIFHQRRSSSLIGLGASESEIWRFRIICTPRPTRNSPPTSRTGPGLSTSKSVASDSPNTAAAARMLSAAAAPRPATSASNQRR